MSRFAVSVCFSVQIHAQLKWGKPWYNSWIVLKSIAVGDANVLYIVDFKKSKTMLKTLWSGWLMKQAVVVIGRYSADDKPGLKTTIEGLSESFSL